MIDFLILLILGIPALYFSHWLLVTVAFVFGLLRMKSSKEAILTGFLTSAMVWAGCAAFFYFQSNGLLVPRISRALMLPSSILLFVVTGLVGGLMGAGACWSGFLLRGLLTRSRA